jgi:hypothetical protein
MLLALKKGKILSKTMKVVLGAIIGCVLMALGDAFVPTSSVLAAPALTLPASRGLADSTGRQGASIRAR